MRFRAPLAVLLLGLFVRCATVHHGRYQNVEVSTNPPGAAIKLDCGSGRSSAPVTPARLTLPRKIDRCLVSLSKDGYAPEVVAFDSHAHRAFWFDAAPVLIGSALMFNDGSNLSGLYLVAGTIVAGVGVGVDAIDGAMWELVPRNIDRNLTPK